MKIVTAYEGKDGNLYSKMEEARIADHETDLTNFLKKLGYKEPNFEGDFNIYQFAMVLLRHWDEIKTEMERILSN